MPMKASLGQKCSEAALSEPLVNRRKGGTFMSLDDLHQKLPTMTMEELLQELMNHAQHMRGFIVSHANNAPSEAYFDAKEAFGGVESCANELLQRINPRA
jgi:hypothetical protein